jgi:hypothetical protein
MQLPSLDFLRSRGLKILREAAAAIINLGTDIAEKGWEEAMPTIKAWVYARAPGDILDGLVWDWIESQVPALWAEAHALAQHLKELDVTFSGGEAIQASGAIALPVYLSHSLNGKSEV